MYILKLYFIKGPQHSQVFNYFGHRGDIETPNLSKVCKLSLPNEGGGYLDYLEPTRTYLNLLVLA